MRRWDRTRIVELEEQSGGRWAVLLLVTTLLCCSALPPVRAAGWTQQQGDYYLKLWDRSLIGQRAYTAEGSVVDVGSYQDHQLNAYFEYGLRPRLTLIAFGSPLGYAKARKSTLYVGPLVGGARYGLLQDGALKLALEGHYGFSPGVGDGDLLARSYLTGSGDSDVARYYPALQNHRAELQLQAGHGLAFGFVSAAIGARLNSHEAISAALTAFAQMGVTVFRDFTLLAHVSAYQPFDGVTVTNVSGAGQTRYVGIGLGAHYQLTANLGVQAGLDGAVGVASNAATPSLQLGIDLR